MSAPKKFKLELIYLFLGYLANIAPPILLTPILANRLGPEAFGRFATSTGIAQYFAYAIELGFNNVAIERLTSTSDQEKRKRTFTSILIIKTFIFSVVGLIEFFVIRKMLIGWGWRPVYAFALIAPLLTCIVYPAWFFVSEGNQKSNFKIQVASKAFIFFCVIFLIKDSSDAPAAMMIYAFSVLLPAIPFVTHWIKFVDFSKRPDRGEIFQLAIAGCKSGGLAIRDAWSSIGIAPIIGYFISGANLGAFALAEKMVRALTIPAPTLGAIILANRSQLKSVLTRLNTHKYKIISGLLLIFLITIISISFLLEKLFKKYGGFASIFNCMSPSIPFVYANYIILNVIHITNRKYIKLSSILATQLIVTLAAAGLLLHFELWNSSASLISLIEVGVFLFLYRDIKNHQIGDGLYQQP